METAIFDTGFEKGRKSYFRNDILNLLLWPWEVTLKVKLLKSAQKLFIRILKVFGNNER